MKPGTKVKVKQDIHTLLDVSLDLEEDIYEAIRDGLVGKVIYNREPIQNFPVLVEFIHSGKVEVYDFKEKELEVQDE